ncbi:hypothetical protein KR009_000911 [Drosophila setifemur]|nr:hypothetical protein KR009_000911 [Drosophila setifemur]
MGFFSSFLRITKYFIIFLGAVFLLPGLPTKTTFPFKEYIVKPPRELKGVLQPNTLLNNAKHLWKDQVFGPENFLVREEGFYTGIHGGEVLRLNLGEKVQHVTKIGQPCDYIYNDFLCGYPVGLASDIKKNQLIISDAFYGIWEFNLETKKKTALVSPQQVLPGKVDRPGSVFNNLAVSRNGDIYYTDSISDDVAVVLFANPSGRLFRYNREKKTNDVLLDELGFANGVALSPNEDFIIVAETIKMRLTKYYLKGSRAGQSEVFVDGLPGFPDNLTPDSEGLWVPLNLAINRENNNNMFATLAPYPRLRRFFSRLVVLIQLPFKFLNMIYPSNISAHLFHKAAELHANSAPNRTTLLRVDWNGNIVRSLHGFDKTAFGISHVVEFEGHFYFGSPSNSYIMQVKLPEADEKSKKETLTN